MIERLKRAIRWEDLLLAIWLIFIAPLLTSPPSSVSAPSAFEGLIGLVGLVGLAICIGARSVPGVSTGLVRGGEIAWAIGPLVGAFALVLDTTIDNLGIGDTGPWIAVVLIVPAVIARFRLPPLDAPQRRALVTPFILVSAGAFSQFLGGLGDLFNLRPYVSDMDTSGLTPLFGLLVAGIALLGVLLFYLMLIFAPRQVAEREGAPGWWAVRFLVFVVSLTIGTTWVGLVRG